MSDQRLELAAIKGLHGGDQTPHWSRSQAWCWVCDTDWPCLPYRLAVRAEEADSLTVALVRQFHRAEAAEAKLARLDARVDELAVHVEAAESKAVQLAKAVEDQRTIAAFLRGPQ